MSIKNMILTLASFLCLAVSLPVSAVDRIVLWERNFLRPEFVDIVTLAADLSKDKYGEYELVSSKPIEQGRAFTTLHTGELLNVAISGIDNERETQGLPIYIPVDRGLLGFRLCLLNKKNTSLQSKNPIEDFVNKRILAGVGTHWPDRQILENNGISVVHTPVFEHLFDMLDAERFDCLLRSVNEIDEELLVYSDYQFNLEPDFAIIYPQADFIFVSVADRRIYERLKYGMELAVENGDYADFFSRHYKHRLFTHRFYQRKLLYLSNRNLSLNAFDAINEYGIASFSSRHIQPLED